MLVLFAENHLASFDIMKGTGYKYLSIGDFENLLDPSILFLISSLFTILIIMFPSFYQLSFDLFWAKIFLDELDYFLGIEFTAAVDINRYKIRLGESMDDN